MTSKVPCRFFAQGMCKFGNSCRFSHSGSVQPQTPYDASEFMNVPQQSTLFDFVKSKNLGYGFQVVVEEEPSMPSKDQRHFLKSSTGMTEEQIAEFEEFIAQDEQEPELSEMLVVDGFEVSVTEDQFEEFFRGIGTLSYCLLCKDPQTGKSLGYGYVAFENPEDFDHAFNLLQGEPMPGININNNSNIMKVENNL
jgi:RNA recognition motif-containing protein